MVLFQEYLQHTHQMQGISLEKHFPVCRSMKCKLNQSKIVLIQELNYTTESIVDKNTFNNDDLSLCELVIYGTLIRDVC